MSKRSQFVSVVAYVHNDRDRIQEFIEVVMNKCTESFKQCELIFVDDFSMDDSVAFIKDYFAQNPVDYIVSIVQMGRYHGMETAMNAGRDMAIGDYVYEFDSLVIDFKPEVVIEAYDKCLEGNDIVTASTNVPLRLTSKFFYKLFNKALASHAPIGQESFRLLSRRGINRITSMNINIPYRKVIYLNSGLSVAQVTYVSTVGVRPPRITGKNERVELALDSFIYFTNLVENLALAMTVLFGLISVAAIIYSIVVPGASLLGTLFMSVGFTGLFAMLALIVKYLSVIIDLVFKNQKYLIADVKKITSK